MKTREQRINKEYFKMAFGFTLSTLTTPLLSSVDTAVVGQLTNPVYIGGVALGGTIFNTMYWILGFLRVSTSGYSAKAYGSKDKTDEMLTLVRPMAIAVTIGLLFYLLQNVILVGAKNFYRSSPEITEQMEIYYKILIWGAPFVLLNYTFLGWIMGRKKIKECLLLQFVTNMVNIILDIYFVKALKMNVAGVAYATLISQVLTTILSVIIVLKEEKNIGMLNEIRKIGLKKVFDKTALKEIGAVKLDLVIRTVCLMTVTNLFMEKTAAYGEITLAGNSILFQIQYLMAYFLDGFANASSVFVGNAIGEKSKYKADWIIKKSFQVSFGTASVLSVLFLIFGKNIISVFSSNPEVIDSAFQYRIWLIIFPLIVNIGLVFYGVFTGATNTKFIRNSMLQSLGMFFIAYFTLIPVFKNHGLWLSFIIFSFGRSLFLYRYLPKLKEEIYSEIAL